MLYQAFYIYDGSNWLAMVAAALAKFSFFTAWFELCCLHIVGIWLCSKLVEIWFLHNQGTYSDYMLHQASYICDEWNWLLSVLLPWPSSHFAQPDWSSATCTLWVFGCAASQLRVEISFLHNQRSYSDYMLHQASYISDEWNGLLCWWLPWPSSHFAQPDWSSATCTLWVFGCSASHLRYDASRTKGVRVMICCIKLFKYMLDGNGY
jgi:hypothetical protein